MSLVKFLLRVKLAALKLISQGREDISLDDFIQNYPSRGDIISGPFPHVVIDNFLQEDIYKKLCREFNTTKNKGLTNNLKEFERFHPFNIDYDGYIANPLPTLDKNNPRSIFYSIEWNVFVSKLFGQPTTFETILAFHHHPKGNRTGFVHGDFSDKFFDLSIKLPNNVIYSARDTVEGSFQTPRKRIIAVIFYLENNNWREGDGGGTGLYSSDGKDLLKTIDPINNRLFLFQISKKSMHAFQENFKERNSVIQWFHAPDSLIY